MADGDAFDRPPAPSLHDQSPFPPIHLSIEDKQTILNQVDELLSSALGEYESHVVGDRGVVSERQWKPVQSRDGFDGYRQRRTSPRAGDSNKVHTVLVVGSLPGSVDDMMLGLLNPSADSAAAFAAFADKESALGSVVLCPIVSPSNDRPDQLVAIKWDARGTSSSTLNRFFMPRDFVTVEAIGSTVNSMGERMEYLFSNSVDIVGAPPLPNMLRGTKHFAFLFRQMSPNEIHVHMSGRIDPKGSAPTGVTVRAVTSSFIDTVLRVKKFAEIKKRTHLVNQRRDTMASLRRLDKGYVFDVDEGETVSGARVCSLCGKTPGISSLFGAAKTCSVCDRSACSSCSESKEVIVREELGSGDSIQIKKAVFCSLCVIDAHNLNGWDVLLAEISP